MKRQQASGARCDSLRCYICGHTGSPNELEPAHTIYLRVLGEPFRKQLYRCRDHGACAMRAKKEEELP